MTHWVSGQGAVELCAHFSEHGFKFGVGDGKADKLPMQTLGAGWLGELGARP